MATARTIAVRSVCLSCASMTQLVKIVSLNPFIITPPNLSDLPFQSVGILDTDTFKQVLVRRFLPSAIPVAKQNAILQMGLNPSVQIGLVINAIEGILITPSPTP